jgi:hypothetical protein
MKATVVHAFDAPPRNTSFAEPVAAGPSDASPLKRTHYVYRAQYEPRSDPHYAVTAEVFDSTTCFRNSHEGSFPLPFTSMSPRSSNVYTPHSSV